MAIAIRGTTPLVVASGTGAATISGTLTGTRQPQSGDVLIIIHGNDFYTASAMPTPSVGGSTTGVTSITSADGGTNFAHAKAYRYTVPSTGDLTVSVTETGAADEEKCLVVYVLSGADGSTVIDASAGNFNSTGSGDSAPVAPSVSPSSSTAFLICHTNSGGGANVTSYTPPSGMTETYDQSAGGFMGCSGAVLQLGASGATGTKTFTAANNATWTTLSIAVLTGSGGPTPIAVGDAGAETEDLAVAASVPLADGGSAGQSLTITATALFADSGSAAEMLAAAASTPLADAGSSTQALTVAAAAGLADSSSAADALTVTVILALADGGSAADGVDNGLGTNKSLADAGSAADTLSVATSIPLADAGAAGQSLGVSATVALADAATATDALTTPNRTIPLADSATAAETMGVAVAVGLADSGSASDGATGSNGASTSKSFGDSGSARDWLHAKAVRPNTGTTFRPNTGITPRPDTGITYRP